MPNIAWIQRRSLTTPITDGARVGAGLNTVPGLPAPTQPTDAQS
jgi:hypothetical protein